MDNYFLDVDGQQFDVIIIGGGINGASAAQNLAADGYNCLVVEKGDFGSGASGRSARMLHIGLRFFEAENPVSHFLRKPNLFASALKGGRQAMQAVGEHMRNAGNRILPYRMCFPVYKNSGFKTWHLQSGLKLLDWLGDGTVDLNADIITEDYSDKIPFYGDFRDREMLSSIACYNEFKFDWPERFCVDMVLDAAKNGSTIINYCQAQIQKQKVNDLWRVTLESSLESNSSTAEVSAPIILNLTGIAIDQVLPPEPGRRPIAHMSKGSHIVVEMPESYKGFGIANVNKDGLPFYILPHYNNLFSIGVTELPFNGDVSNVSCNDEEIDFLIDECNSLLPGRQLSQKDVLSTWSGIRPLTYSEDPLGTRVRQLRDLSSIGYTGIITLTGGPIMSHRSTGRLLLDMVREKLSPRGVKGEINSSPFAFSDSGSSPAFLKEEPEIRIADIENGVTKEYAKTLTDVLLRRTSLAWRRRLSWADANKAVDIVAPLLEWSEEEKCHQVKEFMKFQEEAFRIPGSSDFDEQLKTGVG